MFFDRMPSPDYKPLILGVCGGTASGKTYLAQALAERLPVGAATVLGMDHYYHPLSHLQAHCLDANGRVNFDQPAAVNLAAVAEDLDALAAGQTLTRPEYHFNSPKLKGKVGTLTLRPAPILILEGIFILWDEGLRNRLMLKVFVDTDEPLRIQRRLQRDMQQRGFPLEDILTLYTQHVAPGDLQYVYPSRRYADLIVQNNGQPELALDVLEAYLLRQLAS
jgi:uridine kinase